MATPARQRQRQGLNGPASRNSRTVVTIPPYQPPTQPLNDAALRKLRDYSTSSSFQDLKKHLLQLNNLLAVSAAHINDRYADRADYQAKRRARSKNHDDEDEIPGDAEAETMRIKADELTARIEQGVRGGVDAQVKVEAMEAALKEVNENVARGGGLVAPTQSTLGASQFRGGRRDLNDDEGEEDEGSASEQQRQGLIGAVKGKIDQHDASYAALSMTERYSTNNPYATFKRLVYDAKTSHIEEPPPLSNPATWFPSEQGASASTSQSQTATTATFRSNTSNPSFMRKAANDDPESDIEVAGEKISLKCPLTLLPMQNPLTSSKCPHSFEGEDILNMIRTSNTVVSVDSNGTQTQTQTQGRGARGVRGIKCPVCPVMLTEADLYRDEVLVRKIKREQEKERRHGGDELEEDDDSTNRGTKRKPVAEEIGSSDVEDGRSWGQLPNVKAERRSQAAGMQGGRNAPKRVEEIEDDEEEE